MKSLVIKALLLFSFTSSALQNKMRNIWKNGISPNKHIPEKKYYEYTSTLWLWIRDCENEFKYLTDKINEPTNYLKIKHNKNSFPLCIMHYSSNEINKYG